MSTPAFQGPVLPTIADLAPAPDGAVPPQNGVGPDHTRAVPPTDGPKKTNPVTGALGKLGGQKKARSGVRKLTDDDRDKIERWYFTGAASLMMFRPKASRMLALTAEEAADTWMQWADENDSVRRWILRFMEGGTAAHVFALHLPIAFAFVPDKVWEAMPPMMHMMHPDTVLAAMEDRAERQRSKESDVT